MLTYEERVKRSFDAIRFEDRGHKNKCWIWTKGITSKKPYNEGYGCFKDNGIVIRAHTWFYEQFRENVPQGFDTHHLCSQTLCCNPWHLEAVPHGYHSLMGNGAAARYSRQLECKYGHAFTKENTSIIIDKKGRESRQCRQCDNKRSREYRARKRLQNAYK